MEYVEEEKIINWVNLKKRMRKKQCEFIKKKKEIKKDKIENTKIIKLEQSLLKKTFNKIDISKIKSIFNLIIFKIIKSNPSLIIGYIHIILNFFITCSFIYIVGYLIYFLKIDVLFKINKKREILKYKIIEANKLYKINKCDPLTRVPALEESCNEWDLIIKSQLKALNYTKIIAELLAEVIEEFFSKFTYKSLILLFLIMIFYLKYKK